MEDIKEDNVCKASITFFPFPFYIIIHFTFQCQYLQESKLKLFIYSIRKHLLSTCEAVNTGNSETVIECLLPEDIACALVLASFSGGEMAA